MATKNYKREWGLTLEQQNAVDLLVEGHPDRVVAEEVGVHRVTVTQWRLHDPAFQAALNQRRDELWRDSVDGVRSLLPSALETLVDQLAIGEQRGRLALDLLRHAGVFGRPSAGALGAHLVGPTDPDEILDQEVLRRRTLSRSPSPSPPPPLPQPPTSIPPSQTKSAKPSSPISPPSTCPSPVGEGQGEAQGEVPPTPQSPPSGPPDTPPAAPHTR